MQKTAEARCRAWRRMELLLRRCGGAGNEGRCGSGSCNRGQREKEGRMRARKLQQRREKGREQVRRGRPAGAAHRRDDGEGGARRWRGRRGGGRGRLVLAEDEAMGGAEGGGARPLKLGVAGGVRSRGGLNGRIASSDLGSRQRWRTELRQELGGRAQRPEGGGEQKRLRRGSGSGGCRWRAMVGEGWIPRGDLSESVAAGEGTSPRF